MEITSGQPNISVGGYGDGFGFGSGGGLMFLAFLAMMGMGGGFGGWGNRGPQIPNNVATTDTVNQAVQYSSLVDQNRDLTNSIANAQTFLSSQVADKYAELQRDIAANAVTLANMQTQNMECCCEIKQQIAGLNLENEKRYAALSTKMDQSEIQRLRDQLAQQSQNIQDLKADMRAYGTVKYPNGFVYNAGNNPFCGCSGFIG